MCLPRHGLSLKIKRVVHNQRRRRVGLIFSTESKKKTNNFTFRQKCLHNTVLRIECKNFIVARLTQMNVKSLDSA